MTPPGDGRRLLLTVLFAIWFAAFVYAFVAFVHADITGARQFLGWQAIAGVVAIGIFGVSRAWAKGSPVRQMARLPLLIAGLIATGLVIIRVWAPVQGWP